METQPLDTCAGIADELLAADVSQLEYNSENIRLLCQAELEFVPREGFFDFNASSSGSMLWAIVSAISGTLLADTQLVESINSIIKLIGTRCAKIDIASLTSRVILKKASSFARAGSAFRSLQDDSGCKRWSAVKARAQPVLEDNVYSLQSGLLKIREYSSGIRKHV